MGDEKKVTKAARKARKPAVRAREVALRQREVRVRACMDVMRDVKWVPGVTSVEMAGKLGVAEKTMESIAGEAWRRVAAEVTDPDSCKATIGTALQTIVREAMEETREPALIDGGGERGVYQESPNGARRAVIEAAKTLAAITGVNEPIKVEMVEPTDAEMTSRAIEWLTAQGYKVTKGAK
jgi:hypothetical protein